MMHIDTHRHVPRTWTVHDLTDGAASELGGPDIGAHPPSALVDGEHLPDGLKEIGSPDDGLVDGGAPPSDPRCATAWGPTLADGARIPREPVSIDDLLGLLEADEPLMGFVG